MTIHSAKSAVMFRAQRGDFKRRVRGADSIESNRFESVGRKEMKRRISQESRALQNEKKTHVSFKLNHSKIGESHLVNLQEMRRVGRERIETRAR